MLVFGTETHSAVQLRQKTKLRGWSKLESCTKLPRAACKPGTRLGMKGISSNPKSHLSLKLAERTVTEPILILFLLITLFSALCDQKAVGHNPEGLHLCS